MSNVYDIKQYTAGVNKCLDYTFFAPPGHAVPDLKMWANTGSATSPNWVQLSDDSGVNGARLPHAKVWISGSVDDIPTRIRVSAYDTGSNINDFFANVIDLGGTQAQCEVAGGSSGVLRHHQRHGDCRRYGSLTEGSICSELPSSR